jgi:hypothetical protein
LITVSWPSTDSAAYYDIYYDDKVSLVPFITSVKTGTNLGKERVFAPQIFADIPCEGQNDGRPLLVSLDFTDNAGLTSTRSMAVTMLCAGVPEPPSAPEINLGNRDIISVTWTHPETDGGSPVLGFQIWMKTKTDTTYTLVQDGEENPTLLSFATTTDPTGNPIAPATYQFKVSARNWVGTSDLSEALSVTIPYRVSPDTT